MIAPRKDIKPGDIVVCHVDDRRCGGTPAIGHRFTRWMVESFPGLTSGLSHCANLRRLGNEQRACVAIHWLEVLS